MSTKKQKENLYLIVDSNNNTFTVSAVKYTKRFINKNFIITFFDESEKEIAQFFNYTTFLVIMPKIPEPPSKSDNISSLKSSTVN